MYTALAIVRTYNELYKEAPKKEALAILQARRVCRMRSGLVVEM